MSIRGFISALHVHKLGLVKVTDCQMTFHFGLIQINSGLLEGGMKMQVKRVRTQSDLHKINSERVHGQLTPVIRDLAL
jgi:hypothetical protein